jgi:hypothetical protein
MNNKTQQTAVEWYAEKSIIIFDNLRSGKITFKIWFKEQALLLEQAKEMEKEQKIKNITDYNIMVTEFLLNPLFNLEHSEHAIACEKLSDIRNQFISDHIINYNETYGGNK